MTEEPYRWLEAITNRREYIEDQLTPGLPVVALSAEPGILLLSIKTSTPKLFEIYDHLALGSIGHPADIERVRQTVIDAAHVDGFTRSPNDVTARRLVSYNLAPALKTAFEQIFAAPLLFRGIQKPLFKHGKAYATGSLAGSWHLRRSHGARARGVRRPSWT